MGLETSLHELEDDESMIPSAAEARQRISTDFYKQVPNIGDITSDSDSHVSLPKSKSQNRELATVPANIWNVETASQTTREKTYQGWDKSIGTESCLPSDQKGAVSETGSKVIGKFEEILASLRAVTLTREEAQKVENLLWDVKGELYAAEKRGRVGG
jgi:hypothetical protein